ncbi:unnamed protein product [Caenorhabditis nigoni]
MESHFFSVIDSIGIHSAAACPSMIYCHSYVPLSSFCSIPLTAAEEDPYRGHIFAASPRSDSVIASACVFASKQPRNTHHPNGGVRNLLIRMSFSVMDLDLHYVGALWTQLDIEVRRRVMKLD